MIKKILLSILPILIFACTNNQTENSSAITDSTTVSDSVKPTQTIETAIFPIVLTDSTYNDSTVLSSSFIKKYVLPYDDKLESSWMINTFLMIDSLKKARKYIEYVNNLDIGMTKESQAWIYDTIQYASGNAYIWGITNSSYEACPYFSGKVIFITTISKEENKKSTQKLLEVSSGGDAPVFGSTTGLCTINEDLSILCNDTSTNGEYMDEGYQDVTIEPSYKKYKIKEDGTIQLLESVTAKGIHKKIYNKSE